MTIDRYKVDPEDSVPFRILAERKLNEVGWNNSHTGLVASLLQKLYHSCPSTKIDIDEFWEDFLIKLELDELDEEPQNDS